MKAHYFSVFVIDCVQLIAMDCPKHIFPFWDDGPFVPENYKNILKITNFASLKLIYFFSLYIVYPLDLNILRHGCPAGSWPPIKSTGEVLDVPCIFCSFYIQTPRSRLGEIVFVFEIMKAFRHINSWFSSVRCAWNNFAAVEKHTFAPEKFY